MVYTISPFPYLKFYSQSHIVKFVLGVVYKLMILNMVYTISKIHKFGYEKRYSPEE